MEEDARHNLEVERSDIQRRRYPFVIYRVVDGMVVEYEGAYTSRRRCPGLQFRDWRQSCEHRRDGKDDRRPEGYWTRSKPISCWLAPERQRIPAFCAFNMRHQRIS